MARPVRASRLPQTARARRARRRLWKAGLGGMLLVTVLVIIGAGAGGGRGAHSTATAARSRSLAADSTSSGGVSAASSRAGRSPTAQPPVGGPYATQSRDRGPNPTQSRGDGPYSDLARSGTAVMGASGPHTCGAVGPDSGYLNPTARAKLKSERIDQGVDYAGKGVLTALGAGRVTYVGTSSTGWPGAFIEYRLLAGPDAGCFVYYAEGITPVAGLRRGRAVSAGQVLARIIPGWSTGIEIGWGAGRSTKTYAAARERWTPTKDAEDVATAAGRSFSALIAALGGPPGRIEG